MTRLLCLALLLVFPVRAHTQTTGSVNTVPGSVWTYLGPTFGADWVSPSIAGGIIPKSVLGYYYAGTQATASIGTAAAPSTDPNAVFAIEKNFSTPATQGAGPNGPFQHPSFYSVCHLRAVGTNVENNACRAVMGEAIDHVGGYGTFVEGAKFVAIGADTVPAGTGGAYGIIAWGQSTNSQFTIGIEAQIVRTGGTDAPGPYLFNPNAQITAGFLYSNGVAGGAGQKRADAGFLVNPFNSVKTSMGFACGAGAIEATAGTCFMEFPGAAVGLDLSMGAPHAVGPIILGNNDPIRIKRTDTTLVTALYVGGDNILHLNAGAASNTNVDGNLLIGGNLSVTTGTISVTSVLLAPTVVTALPACAAGTDGMLKKVNDANGPAWNAVIAGGGSSKVLAMCDGTNWRVH